MGSFLNRLIRRASVVRAGRDTGQLPVQQVTYRGKAADAVMIFPYGMHANVDGNSLLALFTFDGNAEDRAGVPTSMTRRSQLGSGDVEVYSPVSRSGLVFRGAGNVDMTVKAALTVTVTGEATTSVGGNSSTTVGGNLTVTVTGTVNVTTSLYTVTGALTVTGDITGANIISQSGFKTGALSGVTGTFTTTDGKTVTVTNGLITNIV